jgi:hypothetical protein
MNCYVQTYVKRFNQEFVNVRILFVLLIEVSMLMLRTLHQILFLVDIRECIREKTSRSHQINLCGSNIVPESKTCLLKSKINYLH